MKPQSEPSPRGRRTSVLHQILMGIVLGVMIYFITLLVSVYVG